jgi:hypothetical protein
VAKHGLYKRIIDDLESLKMQGVKNEVIAEVFELNSKTLITRFSDLGLPELKRMRDRDLAEDAKLRLILDGVLDPEDGHNLAEERLTQIRHKFGRAF